jgi:MOSC domain-containing protein YiiM
MRTRRAARCCSSRSSISTGAIRENVTVEGVDVHEWTVGQQVRVGEALFEITMVCDPCHRMDELRDGLRAQLHDKRGMLAHVVEGGAIALGDAIEVVEARAQASA